MRPIGVGLVGHGASGAFLHGPLLEAAEGYDIRAVVTARRESLVLRRGAPRAVDLNSCLEATDVELIVVASPNALHYAHAHAALEAGKHVVVDKPFVPSVREADALIALSGRVGRTLTVFQNRRFDADFRTVRRLVRSGDLGNVISYDARWDRQEAGSNDPRQLFVDLASHQIDQVIALFGAATNPRLELWSRSTPDGVAVGYDLHLDANAVRCRLSGRTLTSAIGPSLELQASRGAVVCERSDPFAMLIHSGRRPSDAEFWKGVPRPTAVLHLAGRETRLRCSPNAWRRFYDRLAGVLRGAAKPVVTHEQMRRVVSVMETAQA